MNLNQLYYFKTIAKLQHFRLAAQELNISQPSLSYAMANLEEELETCLFEKHGRNIILTKYGKIFLEYVEKSLSILELGEEKVRKLSNNKTGNVDISYVFPLAPSYIPRTVRHFLDIQENKDITFTFKEGITSEIIQGLKTSKYDVGFCSFSENEPAIMFEPILKQELIVIAPLNHPLSKFDSIDLLEIEPYPLIVYEKETGLGKLTLEMFRTLSLSPNIIFEGGNEHAIAGLVSENFGVAVVAKTPDLDNINVKQIQIKNLKHNRYIYLAYVKDRYLNPAVKKFIVHVKQADLTI
ncbi:LysR family transcriptional regulator [Clostridium botulinum]|nr:LysR family transcriptional regulator [Clostridium botulinum]